MSFSIIPCCPGTLAIGYSTYSRTCLRRMFNGAKVSHILPYESPSSDGPTLESFIENQRRISISGVQEKFSLIRERNKLRLVNEGEQGGYILKPIPNAGKNSGQMPANEHLTMQIARRVYEIETAENALIFFRSGEQAYLTKRFDVNDRQEKLATEDFASIAGRTPQTHGEYYKYLGNCLELFDLMRKFLPIYRLEIAKLYKLLIFNYLFSNGDAHFKNFSILETEMGDFRLSPAYDLLNTRLHVNDSDFALEDGLLPRSLAHGKVSAQFDLLGKEAGLTSKQINVIRQTMLSGSEQVEAMIAASFLDEKSKRNYLQAYQGKLKKLANL
jgi:serine/threonine-protein kinase HipA